MPLIHHARQEVVIKIVYFGPGLGGKTSNLKAIHSASRPQNRGKLVSIDNGSERTLFLDFLPMELGRFRGYAIRAHLCSVPGQIAQEATRELVLQHVDGVVFVADSQPQRVEANNYSVRDLHDLLDANGVDPALIPLVVQYNKRDLSDVATVEELRAAIGVPEDVPETEASALEGWGVFETLKAAVSLCLKTIGDPRTQDEGYVSSRLAYPHARFRPAKSESMIEALHPGAVVDDVTATGTGNRS